MTSTMPLLSDELRLGIAGTVALLFHLALMFGLSIGTENPPITSLEVTLIAAPDSPSPLTAGVLAPVAQTGGGSQRNLQNTQGRRGGLMDLPGLRHANDLAMLSAQSPGSTSRPLATSSPAVDTAPTSPSHRDGQDTDTRLLRQVQPGDPVALRSQHTQQQRAPSDDTLQLDQGINTRASQQAAYRELWRQQIERAGSANFPWSALAMGNPKSLSLLVTVRADGSVTHTRILSSSGIPMLDRAALDIVQLAAPFPPFPEALRREAPELGFAYKWEFFPGSRARLQVGRP